MVRDNSIWAGCTDFMNDEKEAIKGYELLRTRWGLQGTETTNPSDGEEIDKAIDRMQSRKERQYLVSASETSDSLTLWRNYGREAVSYAVCLSPGGRLVPVPVTRHKENDIWPDAPADYLDPYLEEVEDGDGNVHYSLSENPDEVHHRQRPGWNRVEYGEARQNEIVDGVAQDILRKGRIEKPAPAQMLMPLIYDLGWEAQLTLIKDAGFRHEEEVRLQYFEALPDWKFAHYRPGPFGVTPYIVLTQTDTPPEETDEWGSQVFEKEPRRLPIVKVRIGPTRYPELAENALRSLLDENGYSHVEVLRSEVPFR